MFGTNGLIAVRDSDLEKLLKYVHREELTCPVDLPGLARVGLQHAAEDLEILRGLDARSVKAVVISVLAERRAR
jgi:hypothetical protein